MTETSDPLRTEAERLLKGQEKRLRELNALCADPTCVGCANRARRADELARVRAHLEAQAQEIARLREQLERFAECASLWCPYEKRMREAEQERDTARQEVAGLKSLVGVRESEWELCNEDRERLRQEVERLQAQPGRDGRPPVVSQEEWKEIARLFHNGLVGHMNAGAIRWDLVEEASRRFDAAMELEAALSAPPRSTPQPGQAQETK